MKTINNIIFDTSAMASALTVRQFTVVGEPGAQFTMTVTNEDNHFYNFSEERDKNGDLKVALAFTATPARLQAKTINAHNFELTEIGSNFVAFKGISAGAHRSLSYERTEENVFFIDIETNSGQQIEIRLTGG